MRVPVTPWTPQHGRVKMTVLMAAVTPASWYQALLLSLKPLFINEFDEPTFLSGPGDLRDLSMAQHSMVQTAARLKRGIYFALGGVGSSFPSFFFFFIYIFFSPHESFAGEKLKTARLQLCSSGCWEGCCRQAASCLCAALQSGVMVRGSGHCRWYQGRSWSPTQPSPCPRAQGSAGAAEQCFEWEGNSAFDPRCVFVLIFGRPM